MKLSVMAFLAMYCPPCAVPPFQSPPNSLPEFRMTPQHLLVEGHRTNTWRGLQDRHDFGVEDVDEWIGTPPFTGRLLLGW
ncbi:hypothetical protein ASD31_23970 [Rhizobium sp. Root482]|nr:hypothetical protein ASD31_23970 [Rhizobium sp. Root482]